MMTPAMLLTLLRSYTACDGDAGVGCERVRRCVTACTMKLGGDEDQDATDTCDRGATTPIPATTPAMKSIGD